MSAFGMVGGGFDSASPSTNSGPAIFSPSLLHCKFLAFPCLLSGIAPKSYHLPIASHSPTQVTAESIIVSAFALTAAQSFPLFRSPEFQQSHRNPRKISPSLCVCLSLARWVALAPLRRMGCFYSKMGPQQTAFSRDLSLSLKKRMADLAPLDGLINSRRSARGEHLMSLFYAANAVSVKMKSQDHLPNKTNDAVEPAAGAGGHEIINTWELMADLQEESDSSPSPPSSSEQEEGEEEKDLENRVKGRETQSPETGDANSDAVVPSSLAEIHESPRRDLSESEQRSKDCSFTAREEQQEGEIKQRPPSDVTTFVPVEVRKDLPEKDLRRKLAAKELRLKVPSFDFSSVLAGGEGSYETPRFGSYGRPFGAEMENDGAFDPELVAELAAALERLTEEEEDILREMAECLQESPE